jgi:hypothetical protein
MSAFSNAIRTPFGIILPLSAVKDRAIVDTLDRCGGNYLSFRSSITGHGEKHGLSHRENVHDQPPGVQAQRLIPFRKVNRSWILGS